MKLDDALAGIDSLGFDTPPIIYFVEAHPHYDALVTESFRRIAAGTTQGVTTVITLTEVLCKQSFLVLHCHVERSETSRCLIKEMLHFVQHDSVFLRFRECNQTFFTKY